MRPPPTTYTRGAANFMAQARAAAQEQDDYFERLREEGWEYDEMVHCWTHPDHPGVTITS